jgi:hypothetical protein
VDFKDKLAFILFLKRGDGDEKNKGGGERVTGGHLFPVLGRDSGMGGACFYVDYVGVSYP